MASTTLSEAINELEDAGRAYETAKRAEDVARMASTDARNRLNKAQKAVDEIVNEMRKDAPRDSDWWGSRNRKMEAV